MKSQMCRVALTVALLSTGAGLCMAGTGEEYPFIGLQLQPVPELLVKHLGLTPGEGVLIANVAIDSPADKAGLERDDLVVGFQGQKVEGTDQFVAAVRAEKIGTEASLEIIHLGKRRTVELTLEPFERSEWKYPSEANPVLAWRPGRLYKVGPEGQNWVEIPLDSVPGIDVPGFAKLFKEIRTYDYMTNGEEYTISVEGNPEDDGSRIVVESGGEQHSTTIGNIDALPEKYRDAARKAVKDARRSAGEQRRTPNRFRLPEPPSPEIYRKYFRAIPRPDMEKWSEQKDRALEKLHEQMERLQQRMKELEERNREMLDRLLDKKGDDRETEKTEKPASGSSGDDSAI